MKLISSFALLCVTFIPTFFSAAETPRLLLANVYEGDVALADYWVSEKLDGVRAYWDGECLVSRGGNVYHAPEWFIAGFPPVPLDGELWMGRGTFDTLSGTVRRGEPDDTLWRQVRYMAFDLPGNEAPFDRRLEALQELVTASSSPYLQAVPQFKVDGTDQLQRKLEEVVAGGGEGLMLHRGASLYRGARTNDLLKLKPYRDAEAVVLEHIQGRGKYDGMMGSILVETPHEVRFRIGTGFSDEERAKPPPIGSTITYKYFGTTQHGTPRFASFLRVRERE